MKPLPYVISTKAISDLEEVWLYTVDKWSIEQLQAFLKI
jgi:plasmid stabilization system protein ParE